MEELAGSYISGLKRLSDDWLEISVADKVVQLSHSGEFMVRVQARVG